MKLILSADGIETQKMFIENMIELEDKISDYCQLNNISSCKFKLEGVGMLQTKTELEFLFG